MPLHTTEEISMDDERDEIVDFGEDVGEEVVVEVEAPVEKAIEQVDAAIDEVQHTHYGHIATVEIVSNVNQYRKGDRFSVDPTQQPWAGLIASNVAVVVD